MNRLRGLLVPLAMLLAAQPVAAAAKPPTDEPVAALTRSADPLRSTEPGGSSTDLRPLLRMIGSARIVGLGEQTHSSHEFLTFNHRLFQTLVEERGFTSLAMEVSWSTGQLLDRYVLTGQGDPREIMRREFQDAYRMRNTQENLDLIEWMREYNRTHHRKVRFVGDDLGYLGPVTIAEVTSYLGRVRPGWLPEFQRWYSGFPDLPEVGAWTAAYWAKPLAERRRIEADAATALARLQGLPPSREKTWAVQNARVIWQVAKAYASDLTDPAAHPAAMRFRDGVMAENVVWWSRYTKGKVLVSAHNGHIAYESSMPTVYPKTQGEYLREMAGRNYVTIGMSFNQGSFNARDAADPAHPWRRYTIGPAPAGNNEHTVDQVRYDDFMIDLRTVGGPTRTWLRTKRPTRDIGTAYPVPDQLIALGSSYDLLVHVDKVTAGKLR